MSKDQIFNCSEQEDCSGRKYSKQKWKPGKDTVKHTCSLNFDEVLFSLYSFYSFPVNVGNSIKF